MHRREQAGSFFLFTLSVSMPAIKIWRTTKIKPVSHHRETNPMTSRLQGNEVGEKEWLNSSRLSGCCTPHHTSLGKPLPHRLWATNYSTPALKGAFSLDALLFSNGQDAGRKKEGRGMFSESKGWLPLQLCRWQKWAKRSHFLLHQSRGVKKNVQF